MNFASVDTRNSRIRGYLEQWYNLAQQSDYEVNEEQYGPSLDSLFSTPAWGFREVLLVVLVGMKLDNEYFSSRELYKCKPRAIYEGPIVSFLAEKRIPHRKSGPLNVAKATQGLNDFWAAQRTPRSVADQVVFLVNYLESGNEERNSKITNVAVSLMRRFIQETNRIENLVINISPSADPDFLYSICESLIVNAPDAGNTAQKICGYILSNYHSALQTGIIVTGTEDRASVTSTTSKKPGDINEESLLGDIYKVYEITTKPFDNNRMHDSFDCISRYNASNGTSIHEICVICRNEDCPAGMIKNSHYLYMGTYTYQNIIYRFVNIYEWIAGYLQNMIPQARINFYNNLNAYISDINTSEAVKQLWVRIHNNPDTLL